VKQAILLGLRPLDDDQLDQALDALDV